VDNLKKFIPRTIKTKRLILRKPRLSDAPEVFEYAGDPEVTKFMTFKTYKNVSEAIPFIKKCLRQWKENTNYSWFITTKRSDKSLGNISLNIKKNKATFGYALSRKNWGKGYMSEALAAIIDIAQKIPNVKIIWGACDAANKGSAKVMQKAGLKYEKTVKGKERVNLSDKIRKDKVFVLKKNGN
jgi:ribosomal-protein-alanine N-acetyltransferase